jgi:AcrR family transcriptional regulator
VADWVEARLDRLADRWLREIQSRYDRRTTEVNGLLEEFVRLLVTFLPAMLGPYRDQVEPLWVRGAELFGNVAARRGLAAGEVIEEFQILREAVIRMLYQEPPLDGRARISLRDVLRLNRAIDRGVTHASVGHTDALFFSLFEGSGVPDVPPTAELKAEIQSQLDTLRSELADAVSFQGTAAAPSGNGRR